MAVATLQKNGNTKIYTSICERCDKAYARKRRDRIGRFCGWICSRKSHPGNPKFWDTATFEQKIKRWKFYFEKRVIKTDSGCWDWNGSLDHGYGRLSRGGGKIIGAHRVSWMIYNGEIPENLIVMHSCDNRQCTNPKHLRIGTHKDNADDKYLRGKDNHVRGTGIWSAKLTEKQVLHIRKLFSEGVNYKMIAKIFNISWPTVYKIKDRRSWRYL